MLGEDRPGRRWEQRDDPQQRGIMINKKALNESGICQNYITPAIERAGWDKLTQVRREYSFTAGRHGGRRHRGQLPRRFPHQIIIPHQAHHPDESISTPPSFH